MEVSFHGQEVEGAGRKDTESTSQREGSEKLGGGEQLWMKAAGVEGTMRASAGGEGISPRLGCQRYRCLSPLHTGRCSHLHSLVGVLGFVGASCHSFCLAPSAEPVGTPPQLARLCCKRPIPVAAATVPPFTPAQVALCPL